MKMPPTPLVKHSEACRLALSKAKKHLLRAEREEQMCQKALLGALIKESSKTFLSSAGDYICVQKNMGGRGRFGGDVVTHAVIIKELSVSGSKKIIKRSPFDYLCQNFPTKKGVMALSKAGEVDCPRCLDKLDLTKLGLTRIERCTDKAAAALLEEILSSPYFERDKALAINQQRKLCM